MVLQFSYLLTPRFHQATRFLFSWKNQFRGNWIQKDLRWSILGFSSDDINSITICNCPKGLSWILKDSNFFPTINGISSNERISINNIRWVPYRVKLPMTSSSKNQYWWFATDYSILIYAEKALMLILLGLTLNMIL